MLQRPLRPIALLLVAGLLYSQNLYAFGPAVSCPINPAFNAPHHFQLPLETKEVTTFTYTKEGTSLGVDPRLSSLLGIPIANAMAQTLVNTRWTGDSGSEADIKNGVSLSGEIYIDEQTGQTRRVEASQAGWWQNTVNFFKDNLKTFIDAGIRAYYATRPTPSINGSNPLPTTTQAPLPDGAVDIDYQTLSGQTKQGYKIATGPNNYVIYDRMTGFAAKRVSNGVVEEGVFDYLPIRKADGAISFDFKNPQSLAAGNIYYTAQDGGRASFKISEKNVQELRIDVESPNIRLEPGTIKDVSNKIINGIIYLLGLTIYVVDGNVSKNQQGNGLSSQELSKALKRAYIFGNGFNNEEVPEGTLDNLIPPFIRHLEGDQVIEKIREYLVAMFEVTNIFGNASTWGADIMLRIQDKDFFRNLLRGEVAVWVPEPLKSWLDKGIQIKLVQKVIDQLDALQKTQGVISDGIAFAHSGFFAPFLVAMQQKNYDVSTIINYEGPFVDWNATIQNTHLKRVINVWGTAGLFEGDLGPPLLDPANFQGIDNVNIEIKGAFHNDFSYNSNDYADRTGWGEKEIKREFINRQTNLFVRRVYAASLKDQTSPGVLKGFLESLEFDGGAELKDGIWKIDPYKLRL